MGGRISKPNDEPQLYAVATPHPTLQYIYPVYAAPVDPPQVEDKRRKRSASVPSTWGRSEKSKKKRKIVVIGEAEASAYLSPVQREDGAWYCYRESCPCAINLITRLLRHRLFARYDTDTVHLDVDHTGTIDYVEPGETHPSLALNFSNRHFVVGTGTAVPSSPTPERSPQQYFVPPPHQALIAQHMLSTSPYSNSACSYPVSSPPYMAQPQPISYASPTHMYAHAQQPHPHLYQQQPPPQLRARSVSPPRSRGMSPAPAYHQAAAPSPSTSYGRTVTPILGRQTSPSPGSRYRPQNTPYPRPQAPVSFSPSSSHRTPSDDEEDGETQITESGVSPVAYAGLASRRPLSPTAFSVSSRGTQQTGHVIPTPPPEGSSWSHSSLAGSSPRSRTTNNAT